MENRCGVESRCPLCVHSVRALMSYSGDGNSTSAPKGDLIHLIQFRDLAPVRLGGSERGQCGECVSEAAGDYCRSEWEDTHLWWFITLPCVTLICASCSLYGSCDHSLLQPRVCSAGCAWCSRRACSLSSTNKTCDKSTMKYSTSLNQFSWMKWPSSGIYR